PLRARRSDGAVRLAAASEITVAFAVGLCSTGRVNRCVLSQRVVRPVLMVIAHVIPKQAQNMTLVPSNNMVLEFTAAASDQTLGGFHSARALARWFVSVSNPCKVKKNSNCLNSLVVAG